MSEKRIKYICVYCGKTKRMRVSSGESPAEICPKRNHEGFHLWVDCQSLNRECCADIQKSDTPIAEYMYYMALDCENSKEAEMAILWYEKAAELKHIKSILALGDIYEKGNIVPKNINLALQWYRRAAEAESVEAMFKLGKIYEGGLEIQKNLDEAEKWYKLCADKGSSDAKISLARLYELKGQKSDAISIYRGLIPNGMSLMMKLNTSVLALIQMGIMADPLFTYVTDVMNQTTEDNAEDLARRGYAHENGTAGVEKNIDKAIEWYKKAANMGDRYSLFALGNIYSEGEFKDEEIALKYFRKALN